MCVFGAYMGHTDVYTCVHIQGRSRTLGDFCHSLPYCQEAWTASWLFCVGCLTHTLSEFTWLCSTALGLHALVLCWLFYIGAGELNPGPHACRAMALTQWVISTVPLSDYKIILQDVFATIKVSLFITNKNSLIEVHFNSLNCNGLSKLYCIEIYLNKE